MISWFGPKNYMKSKCHISFHYIKCHVLEMTMILCQRNQMIQFKWSVKFDSIRCDIFKLQCQSVSWTKNIFVRSCKYNLIFIIRVNKTKKKLINFSTFSGRNDQNFSNLFGCFMKNQKCLSQWNSSILAIYILDIETWCIIPIKLRVMIAKNITSWMLPLQIKKSYDKRFP